MSSHLHLLRTGIGSLALLGMLAANAPFDARTITSEETALSVRRMLERLPYYGVFDFIVFRVESRNCLSRRLQLRGPSENGCGSRHETGQRRGRSRQQD